MQEKRLGLQRRNSKGCAAWLHMHAKELGAANAILLAAQTAHSTATAAASTASKQRESELNWQIVELKAEVETNTCARDSCTRDAG